MIKERGMTLITLVVTIIIMLILSGVTIFVVFGSDGIINRANEAKEETIYKKAEEKVRIAVIDSYNKLNVLDLLIFKDNIRRTEGFEEPIEGDEFPVLVIVDEYIFEVSADGEVSGKGKRPPTHYAKNTITKLVLSDNQTTLKTFSFYDCKLLNELTLPNSLNTID